MNFLIKIRKEERKESRGFWRKVSYLLTLQRAGPYSDLSLRVLFNQPGSSKATASQQHYHIIQWLLTFKLTKSSQISHIHVCESHSVMSDSLRPHGLYSPWNSPGQNTRVVVFPFSWGSSQPRGQTQVSYTAGGFFTSWATKEAQG